MSYGILGSVRSCRRLGSYAPVHHCFNNEMVDEAFFRHFRALTLMQLIELLCAVTAKVISKFVFAFRIESSIFF